MSKETIGTRFGGDLSKEIEQYADENGVNNSDAVRHFVRQGVKAEREPATDGGRAHSRFTFVELLTITVMLSAVMTWVLTAAAGEVYFKWAMVLTAASAVLLAVYFGEVVFEAVRGRSEAPSR